MKTFLKRWIKRLKRLKRLVQVGNFIRTVFMFLVGLANLVVPAYLFYKDHLEEKLKESA